jgi:DNA polymerase-3 subunit gamma/tau
MEDDPKFSKISSVLQSFDENLNDLLRTDTDSLEKLCNSLIKDALYLENEGFGTTIPIGHIRRAAYWCRLAPNGKHKILIIENADNMRDEARNSLLKLLEEPPASVSIVLTAQRKEAIIPTILSRLRPYHFLKRSMEGEKEVLRRVFQVSQEMKKPETGGSLISIYLDSFLPQNTEKLFSLAAWFIVSLARITALSTKRKTGNIPRFIALLGERYAPIAETSGFERSVKSAGIVKTIVTQSSNFENDTFSRFLNICLDLIGAVAREADEPQFNDIFKKYIGEAVTAVDVLNQNTSLALESLIYNLKTGMVSAA